MRDLSGKVAVVTGAASGIGRSIAHRLVREGMQAVLSDIDERALDGAVQELRGRGFDVVGVVTDVSSREAVQELAHETLSRYGAVHLVCLNAGVEGHMDGPIWEATENDWQWTLGVNLWGAVHGTQTFLPLLLDQGEGHLAITASATGYILPRNMYVVSKHALVAFAELAYSQLKQMNAPVEMSLLCPGSVATHIFQHERPADLRNPPDETRDREAAEFRRRMAEKNQRGMHPDRVADALIEGIKEDRFYVFSDHEWDPLIRSYFDGVLERRNPVPDQYPVRTGVERRET